MDFSTTQKAKFNVKGIEYTLTFNNIFLLCKYVIFL
jgi:hypothetical protein